MGLTSPHVSHLSHAIIILTYEEDSTTNNTAHFSRKKLVSISVPVIWFFANQKFFWQSRKFLQAGESKYKYYQYFLTVLDLGGCGGICSFLEMEACEIKRAESNFYHVKNYFFLMYNNFLPIWVKLFPKYKAKE